MWKVLCEVRSPIAVLTLLGLVSLRRVTPFSAALEGVEDVMERKLVVFLRLGFSP